MAYYKSVNKAYDQVERQKSARKAYTYRRTASKIQEDNDDVKKKANDYIASLKVKNYTPIAQKGRDMNPLRKEKDTGYYDEDNLTALDVLYASGYGDVDNVKNYMTQKAQNEKSEYQRRLERAQKKSQDAENTLYSAQQEIDSISAGFGDGKTAPDINKLQEQVEKSYEMLRNVQAEHPAGDPVTYGVEQGMLAMRTGAQQAKSGLTAQVGRYNADISRVLNGEDPQTEVGYITRGMAEAAGGADKLKDVLPGMVSELEKKEQSEGLNPFEKLQLYYFKDFASGGGESSAAIQKNADINQADTEEVERLYTNVPEGQRAAGRLIGGGIGSGLSTVGLYALNPGIGGAYSYYSAGGQGAEQVINDGGTIDEAAANAKSRGTTEVVVEQMFSGLPYVGGLIEGGNKAAGKIANPYIQAGIKRAVDAAGEGTEEIITQALQPFIDRATYDPDAPLPTFDELAQAFGGGYIASAFLGLPVDIQTANVNYSQQSSVGRDYNNPESVQGLIDSGLESDKKSVSYSAAEQMQKQVNKGKTPTDQQVGRLAMENQAEIDKESAARVDAAANGEIGIGDLQENDIRTLVDPANLQETNARFGLDLPDTADPADIYMALRAKSAEVQNAPANTAAPDMQQVISDYKNATDPELADFVQSVYDEQNKKARNWMNHDLSDVREREARDIKNITGIDITGYRHNVSGGEIDHINIRHGKNGDQDHSMADIDDVARMNYVLENYDSVALLLDKKGNPIKSGKYKNSDNTPSQMVVFKKRINGDYYLVEAVPDASKKKLRIISAYIESAKSAQIKDGVARVPNANASGFTSETGLESAPSNQDIAQPTPEVKMLPENATGRDVIKHTMPMTMTTAPRAQKTSNAEAIFAGWDAFQRKMVDAAHTIDTLGKKVGDKELYNILNNARQARQAGEFMIGKSITGQKAYQANFKGENVGESLDDIWKPIKAQGGEYYQSFMNYLFHAHNIDRMAFVEKARDALAQFELENPGLKDMPEKQLRAMAAGKEIDLAGGGKMTVPESERQTYKDYLELIDGYKTAADKPVFGYEVTAEQSLKAVRDHEVATPEFKDLAAKVYKYNNNLIDYRVDTGLLSQEQAQMLRDTYPHYVPTFRDFSGTKGASKQGSKVQISQTVKKATGSDKPLVNIDASMAQQTLQVVSAAKKNQLGLRMLQIARENADTVGDYITAVREKEGLTYDVDDQTGTIYAEKSGKELKNQFLIYDNGQPVTMDVSPAIFEGLTSLSSPPRGPGWAIKGNDMYKRLITGYNPIFIPRNFLKDLQDAGLYTKHPDIFVKNFGKAWKEITTNGKLWQQYQALGGFQSSFFDYNKKMDSRHKALQRWTLDKVETVNMMIEQAPRFAEFLCTIEKGGTSYENLMRAMYNAADITVNFGRAGTWGRVLNSTFVPFFNPSIQGFDKLVRRFKETSGAKAWTGLTIRAAVLGVLPSLLNALLYDDDDEYQLIDDRTKDTYYLFKMGDGVWAKIPKGRVLSLFGSASQRLLRAAKGENGAFAGFVETMASQVAPSNPFTSNIASAVIDAASNKTWYGGNIENQADQNKRPEDRYDQSTSTLAIWLGRVLKQSPKKINYLLDSYTGVIGDFALPLTTPRAEQNPFTKAFTVDVVYSNRISDDFYNAKQELVYQKSEEPISDVPSVIDLTSRYFSKQADGVSEIYKQIGEIENSDLSDSEKRQQVRELRVLINGIQQGALQGAPELQKAIEKHYAAEVDPGAAEDVQTRQAEIAYLKATKEVFGSEYALKTAGKDVYKKAQDLNAKGTSYDSFYNFYSETRTTDGKAMKDADRVQVLSGLNLQGKDIENIYASEFEDKNTKPEKSIAYAINQGVRPEAFVQRQIDIAQAEGDKKGSTEAYLVNGQLVTASGETTADGTKKRDAMASLLTGNYTSEEMTYFYQKEYPADDKYVYAMVAGIPIEAYVTLQRDEWDIHGEKDAQGNTISGSKKAAYIEYVKTLPINPAQRAILLMQNGYVLDTANYKNVAQYIAGLDIPVQEKLSLADAIGLATSGNKILYQKKK
jgi:hypothetical protein